jgi:hypothetical protein
MIFISGLERERQNNIGCVNYRIKFMQLTLIDWFINKGELQSDRVTRCRFARETLATLPNTKSNLFGCSGNTCF